MTPGTTLAALGAWGSGRVLLFCGSCTWSRAYPVETIIARLKARRFGDERTTVEAVARHVQWPCPACRRMRWGTRPAPSISDSWAW